MKRNIFYKEVFRQLLLSRIATGCKTDAVLFIYQPQQKDGSLINTAVPQLIWWIIKMKRAGILPYRSFYKTPLRGKWFDLLVGMLFLLKSKQDALGGNSINFRKSHVPLPGKEGMMKNSHGAASVNSRMLKKSTVPTRVNSRILKKTSSPTRGNSIILKKSTSPTRGDRKSVV